MQSRFAQIFKCFKGKGLGRNEDGAPKPIKNSLKFDKAGIGYNEKVSKETTNPWWVEAYNEAASKTSSSNEKPMSNSAIDEIQKAFNNLTDEELFAACGGRTAHKAARHGLKLNGKLERVEKQEILAVSKIQPLSGKTEEIPQKSKKRKKPASGCHEEVGEPVHYQTMTLTENSISKKKKKIKKAKEDEPGVDNTSASASENGCEGNIPTKKSKKRKKSVGSQKKAEKLSKDT